MGAPYSRVAFLSGLRDAVALSDPAVRLALILDGYADEHGRCWPSQTRMARDLDWSLRKTKRAVAELMGFGVVVYEERARHRGERSMLRLCIPDLTRTGANPDTGDKSDTGAKSDHEPVPNLTGTGVKSGTQNYPRNSRREYPQGTPGGSPNGEKVRAHQDERYLAWCEQALRDIGHKLNDQLLAEPERDRAKLRAAVMEQLDAGAEPVRLARVVCSDSLAGSRSLAAVLSARVREHGPEVARRRGNPAAWTGNGGAPPEPERRGYVTMRD